MHKQTKAKNFDKKTIQRIDERDEGCIFCKVGRWPGGNDLERSTFDVAHIVNKSQGGIGIEENGVKACRFHHHMLDNGNRGYREEMQKYIEKYMERFYPEWNKQMLLYHKF